MRNMTFALFKQALSHADKESRPPRGGTQAVFEVRSMYKDYFRLAEEPFNITPDPRYLDRKSVV